MLANLWNAGLLNSAYVFKVVMGGSTIFQQNSAVSFLFLSRNVFKLEKETLLESFYIAKKNVCPKLVLLSRWTIKM